MVLGDFELIFNCKDTYIKKLLIYYLNSCIPILFDIRSVGIIRLFNSQQIITSLVFLVFLTFCLSISLKKATQHLKQSPPLKSEVKKHEKTNPVAANLP
jgi:hypothetical protein